MKRNIFTFYLLLSIIAIVWIIPFLFMVFTSLKSPRDLFQGSLFSIPNPIYWDNFIKAWLVGNMSLYMKNSLIITLCKVPLGIFIAALAAYGLTTVDLRKSTSTIIFVFFLIGMMTPVQVTLVPLNIMFRYLGLHNTYYGIIITYIGFGISFGILILRGFFRTIPKSISEASRIDGCSYFRLFYQIILPMSKPAIATLIILDFLATWNEFLIASVLITKNILKTVPTGIMAFRGQFGTDYTLMNAGVLISILPVLVIYFIFQKYFVKGFEGSVKG